MVRDLTNLKINEFVSLMSGALNQPLHGANESTYIFIISEFFRFGDMDEKIKPATPGETNVVLTTDNAYHIIQLTVNKTAEAALALIDEYKSKYFNDGRGVLCLGINYRYIGSGRVSLQDRFVVSWVAEFYSENGTLNRTFPAQEEVYKRYAIKTDKRDNFQKLKRQPVASYYDIMQLLGKGEYSEVFACREIRTGNHFAAKVEYIHYPSHLTKEKIFIEVDMMRLLDHPNLIRMHDAFETDEDITMILDL